MRRRSPEREEDAATCEVYKAKTQLSKGVKPTTCFWVRARHCAQSTSDGPSALLYVRQQAPRRVLLLKTVVSVRDLQVGDEYRSEEKQSEC